MDGVNFSSHINLKKTSSSYGTKNEKIKKVRDNLGSELLDQTGSLSKEQKKLTLSVGEQRTTLQENEKKIEDLARIIHKTK